MIAYIYIFYSLRVQKLLRMWRARSRRPDARDRDGVGSLVALPSKEQPRAHRARHAPLRRPSLFHAAVGAAHPRLAQYQRASVWEVWDDAKTSPAGSAICPTGRTNAKYCIFGPYLASTKSANISGRTPDAEGPGVPAIHLPSSAPR